MENNRRPMAKKPKESYFSADFYVFLDNLYPISPTKFIRCIKRLENNDREVIIL